MKENTNTLPDELREIVYSNDKIVPPDIQEIRNQRIIRFYRFMIEDAQTEKEVWDIFSGFMKIHKKEIDELSEVIDLTHEKISSLNRV